MSAGDTIAAARPRVIAALAAQLRDLDLAEECCDAAVEALLRTGEFPRDCAAWLFVAARRKALDALRRRRREQLALGSDSATEGQDMGEVIELPDPIPDERLRLIFICCHPALATEARVALALKVICGLSVEQIARGFVVPEATMYQRITRAKAKVRDAGIGFELPHRRHWPERLEAVLLALELAYAAAFRDAADSEERQLAAEVERLALTLAELLPDEPEVLGMAAMVLLARSRERARLDGAGAMVPLSLQDTTMWDRQRILRGSDLLARAAQGGSGGPYQLMAAIQLTHARRAFEGVTDWQAILTLYDGLLVLRPDPVIALNRALALAKVEGSSAGLAALASLPGERLAGFLPFHAARADLLRKAGDFAAAREAIDQALALDPAPAERRFLEAERQSLGETRASLDK